MAEETIPVDLLNPGQVFACLGFLEAAEIILGNARGGFDWTDEADIRFRLRADGDDNPFEQVLMFLRDAEVTSRSAAALGLNTEKWNVPTTQFSDETPLPFSPPVSPATLTAVLSIGDSDHPFSRKQIELTYWGDHLSTSGRDNVKFWAGAAGYPGAGLARDMRDSVADEIIAANADPFSLTAELSNSFRLDWRRDYIAIDIGFSLNAHNTDRFKATGYPLVEILAAIGLTHARPEFHEKLHYCYGVLGVGRDSELFEPFFLRASLSAPDLPFPQRTFSMNLGWPGKEGQARCITNVFEETSQ